jgi:FKBP-type peptidyl-prolyl cis-trans isomerase FklB
MKIAFLTGLSMAAGFLIHAADPASPPIQRARPQFPPPGAASRTNAPAAPEFKPNAPLSKPEANEVLKTDVDKLSYSLGINMGTGLKMQEIEVNADSIMRGIKDGLAGKEPLMTQPEIQGIQDHVRKELMARRETKANEMRDKNKVESEKFLAENSKKEGVKTLPGGVQYKVIKDGAGPKPKATDRVKVQYRGTLMNGQEFDSSSKHGPDPATFGVGQVIKGWTQALTNMPVGSKWQLFIPPDLAYGTNGSGRLIEPNSALIFDVELVDIAQAEQPPQPVTSDIIKVPSKAELDAGAKIEVIKPEDLAKYTNKNSQAKPATRPATAPK